MYHASRNELELILGFQFAPKWFGGLGPNNLFDLHPHAQTNSYRKCFICPLMDACACHKKKKHHPVETTPNVSQSSPLQRPNKSIKNMTTKYHKKVLEIPTQLKARFPCHLIYKMFGFPNFPWIFDDFAPPVVHL